MALASASVIRRATDAVPSAQLADPGPGVRFLENPNDLLFVEPALPNRRSPCDRLNYQMEGIPGSRSRVAGTDERSDAKLLISFARIFSA